MLGNAVPERTINLVGLLYSRCEICVFIFLSWSFLLLPIFSSFSNNAVRHDLPNRQSVNSQSTVGRLVSQTVGLERLVNMGFTTISLSSNVKNSLVVRHSFLCNNLL